MNLLLASFQGNIEKPETFHTCLYCKKVFSNYRSLGGHCRVHRREINLWSHNYPRNSSNLVVIAGANFHPVVSNQLENSFRVATKLLPLFDIVTSPSGFSKTFSLCRTCFFDINLGNARSQSFSSPNLLIRGGGGAMQHSNFSSSTAARLPNINWTRCLDAFSFRRAAEFPFNPSPSLGTNETFQFSSIPIVYSSTGLGLKQSYGIKESTIGLDSFPQSSYPNQANVDHSNKRNLLSLEGTGRSYLGAVTGMANIMTASKRPRTNSWLTVQTKLPPKKELLLFKDRKLTFPGSEASSDAEEKGQGDIDLSLHL
ncbi:hypothetical protein Tsubulata_024430 [Turnera subulata]|uniref:C2H2-type domain-containing protein n=1 Tax=Turnera subulata TaxID=218843 RepID=A0A9Q0J6P1_9ROSI|nr:hypothetical protein Tsubulata_024430 [Turnera subulata]